MHIRQQKPAAQIGNIPHLDAEDLHIPGVGVAKALQGLVDAGVELAARHRLGAQLIVPAQGAAADVGGIEDVIVHEFGDEGLHRGTILRRAAEQEVLLIQLLRPELPAGLIENPQLRLSHEGDALIAHHGGQPVIVQVALRQGVIGDAGLHDAVRPQQPLAQVDGIIGRDGDPGGPVEGGEVKLLLHRRPDRHAISPVLGHAEGHGADPAAVGALDPVDQPVIRAVSGIISQIHAL